MLLLSCWPCQLFFWKFILLLSLYIFKTAVCLRNSINFLASQFLPSITFKSPWILYFFLLFLHWRHSWKQCLIENLWFQHVACCSFLDNILSMDKSYTFVCPIRSLLALFDYVLLKTILATFSFFKTKSNTFWIASSVFPLSLPFVLSSLIKNVSTKIYK